MPTSEVSIFTHLERMTAREVADHIGAIDADRDSLRTSRARLHDALHRMAGALTIAGFAAGFGPDEVEQALADALRKLADNEDARTHAGRLQGELAAAQARARELELRLAATDALRADALLREEKALDEMDKLRADVARLSDSLTTAQRKAEEAFTLLVVARNATRAAGGLSIALERSLVALGLQRDDCDDE